MDSPMRINNNTHKINFEKKLIGLGAIKQEDISKAVKFFQLDELSDMKDLKKARKTTEWVGNYYLNDLVEGSDYFHKRFDIITMEDEAQNVIAYSMLSRSGEQTIISTLEAAPKYSCYRENRTRKFIGESMMAFIAALSGEKSVKAPDIAFRKKTRDFYFSQCFFTQVPFSDDGVLMKKNLKKLIKSNEAHTGKKVELIG